METGLARKSFALAMVLLVGICGLVALNQMASGQLRDTTAEMDRAREVLTQLNAAERGGIAGTGAAHR